MERECDGPMNVVEAGGRLDIFEVAQLIGPDEAGDGDLRYKLDYQVGSEAPFHFVSSNAFTVRREGVNCEGARQIALEHARSSPYWGDLDVSRAAIRWQDESQSCTVDFAWRGTDQIRAGLWSEGYVVTVAAGSGRVTEANAYER